MIVKEAAKILGVHEKTIYNMIKDGRLKATKDENSKWDVSDEQLSAVMEQSEVGRELSIASQILYVYMNKKRRKLTAQTLTIFKKYVAELESKESLEEQETTLKVIMNEIGKLQADYNEIEALRKVQDRMMDDAIEKLSILDTTSE